MMTKEELNEIDRLKDDSEESLAFLGGLYEGYKARCESKVLSKREKGVVEAATLMRKEFQAVLRVHGPAIGMDYGNSNMEAVEYRIKNFNKALKPYEEKETMK